MMQLFLGYQGLLFQLVTLITLSITAGLNCSYCTDVKKVEILKNTVAGLNLSETAILPSSPNCETAVNGERVSGIDIGLCYDNPTNSSKEYRCVHYSGQVTTSLKLDLGSSVGEVQFRYTGTYRSCSLVDVNDSGSCVKETVLLPEGNDLSIAILGTIPAVSKDASVVFQGRRCVSNANGRFPSLVGGTPNAVKKSYFHKALFLVLIYPFVGNL